MNGSLPCALPLFVAVWVAGSLRAQDSLADLPVFREGCQALADERFATAVERFRQCLDEVGDQAGGEDGTGFVTARLLEALVRNGDADAAIAWAESHPLPQDLPTANLWMARAFEDGDRFAEAAEQYNLYLAAVPQGSVGGNGPAINRSICLARSGRAAAAFELVRGSVVPASSTESLRLAQIAAAAGEFDEASRFLRDLDEGEPVPASLRLPLARLRIHLLERHGKRGDSLAVAYRLVEESPDAESARLAFLVLEQLVSGEVPAELASRLDQWAGNELFPGREAAALFRLVFAVEDESRLEKIAALTPRLEHPALRKEAAFRSGKFPPPSGSSADLEPGVTASLPADLALRTSFREASSLLEKGEFTSAGEIFLKLAESEEGSNRERHLFNAILTALRANQPEVFAAREEELARSNPRSPLLAEVDYFAGLHFAGKDDARAFERLGRFVSDHPEHPLNVEARIALAEIHLNQAPPRPEAAREILEALLIRPLSLAQSERLDYTFIWVERTSANSGALLRRASEFVTSWPSSEYLEEVMMILGFEHYARKNFEAATLAFRNLVARFPDSPNSERARFFEAKSLPPGNDAVTKWRELIALGGSLANEARHELGLVLLEKDRYEEANEELRGLLGELPEDSPLRWAVMSDLAYAAYARALDSEPNEAELEEAANRFAAVSNLASAPTFWRYNAAVRRGKCLEALGRPNVALEIYRSIVEETSGEVARELTPRESEWVYRAGFAAIEILNADKNWPAAIALADVLSEKSGPRAIEAARLGESLRLKHWVWD